MSLAVFVLSYLLGAVPFGMVFAWIFRLGDLRQIGSGNIGATNVLRTGNKLAAFLTLILDAGKGAIAVLLTRALTGSEDLAGLAGLFAFLGHLYPIYLKFRGGKGVATFLGTVLAVHWPLGLIACATWAVLAAVLRYSSLSALVAAAVTPLVAFWIAPGFAGITALMALLIFLKHRSNMVRLWNGNEPKIGKGN